jgi:hypothetical protein
VQKPHHTEHDDGKHFLRDDQLFYKSNGKSTPKRSRQKMHSFLEYKDFASNSTPDILDNDDDKDEEMEDEVTYTDS